MYSGQLITRESILHKQLGSTPSLVRTTSDMGRRVSLPSLIL